LVQPVVELATYLAVGVVFLQSDIEALAVEMCDRFSAHPAFQRQGMDWLKENPVPTERERATLSRENLFIAPCSLCTKKNDKLLNLLIPLRG